MENGIAGAGNCNTIVILAFLKLVDLFPMLMRETNANSKSIIWPYTSTSTHHAISDSEADMAGCDNFD
jgi:hypothetical protein